MPLRRDEEEGKKVHKNLVNLVLASHEGVLGPNGANLGKLLSIFAEIYEMARVVLRVGFRRVGLVKKRLIEMF